MSFSLCCCNARTAAAAVLYVVLLNFTASASLPEQQALLEFAQQLDNFKVDKSRKLACLLSSGKTVYKPLAVSTLAFHDLCVMARTLLFIFGVPVAAQHGGETASRHFNNRCAGSFCS